MSLFSATRTLLKGSICLHSHSAEQKYGMLTFNKVGGRAPRTYPLNGRTLQLRCLSSTTQRRAPEQIKSKPKESTPLRKSASASLPIRKKPTPTRGQIQPVFTLTTAERYSLQGLKRSLPPGFQLFQDAYWIPKWSYEGGEGEIFVFPTNGSLVCWGLGEAQTKHFAATFISNKSVEISPLNEVETEDLDFVTDPSESTRLQGDLIVLGHVPPLDPSIYIPEHPQGSLLMETSFAARYAFSQALARSTALSALESSLDDYLSSVSLLPDTLSSTGKPGLSRTQLIKKLGELLKFRQGLNLNRENFADTPDFYWTEAILEGYFNSLSEALEMKARTASVNEKITYAAEVQSVLRQLLTEKSGHRMELIIIALIAVEVVIAIIRDGPELWHLWSETETHQGKEPAISSLTSLTTY